MPIFWSRTIGVCVAIWIVFGTVLGFAQSGLGIPWLTHQRVTLTAIVDLLRISAILGGFGYLLGMVIEHKRAFDAGRMSGSRYGLGILAGLGGCVVWCLVGWALRVFGS